MLKELQSCVIVSAEEDQPAPGVCQPVHLNLNQLYLHRPISDSHLFIDQHNEPRILWRGGSRRLKNLGEAEKKNSASQETPNHIH